jgi:hypothetical protein
MSIELIVYLGLGACLVYCACLAFWVAVIIPQKEKREGQEKRQRERRAELAEETTAMRKYHKIHGD